MHAKIVSKLHDILYIIILRHGGHDEWFGNSDTP